MKFLDKIRWNFLSTLQRGVKQCFTDEKFCKNLVCKIFVRIL